MPRVREAGVRTNEGTELRVVPVSGLNRTQKIQRSTRGNLGCDGENKVTHAAEDISSAHRDICQDLTCSDDQPAACAMSAAETFLYIPARHRRLPTNEKGKAGNREILH